MRMAEIFMPTSKFVNETTNQPCPSYTQLYPWDVSHHLQILQKYTYIKRIQYCGFKNLKLVVRYSVEIVQLNKNIFLFSYFYTKSTQQLIKSLTRQLF